MQSEPVVIREKTWKYWLIGGPQIAPGADRYWRMHAYTKRKRRSLFVLLGLTGLVPFVVLMSGVLSGWVLSPIQQMNLSRYMSYLMALFAFIVIRLAMIPTMLYAISLAARIRREDGRVCWDCGARVGTDDEGECACGTLWNRAALRDFWVATELLAATKAELREARFHIDAGRPRDEPTRWMGIVWSVGPLGRAEMATWNQRPLTTKWLKSALRMGALGSVVGFVILMVSISLLLRTLIQGSTLEFIAGMFAMMCVMVTAQLMTVRLALSSAVRKAKKTVSDMDAMICTDCGFALTGLNDVTRCPECGETYTAEQLRAFFRTCGLLDAAPNESGVTSSPSSEGFERTK